MKFEAQEVGRKSGAPSIKVTCELTATDGILGFFRTLSRDEFLEVLRIRIGDCEAALPAIDELERAAEKLNEIVQNRNLGN